MKPSSSRARILWLDDQVEVARTLASVLDVGSLKVRFVSTATEALERLEKEEYDLAIVDLMVPPETWGGLWLLKQLAEREMDVPVLVLSGEGSQVETIEAQRLGARDYVRKEDVQRELASRVDELLKRSAAELQERAASWFPTPLAIAYRRYVCGAEPEGALRGLLVFYEQALRLCSFLGLAQLSHSGRVPHLPDRLRMSLARPAMGSWNEARTWLTQEVSEAPFREFNAAFDDRNIAKIVAIRNDLAHGAGLSVEGAERLLRDLAGTTQQFIRRLCRWTRFAVILPVALKFDGSRFEIRGYSLLGDNVTLQTCRMSLARPMITSHAQVVWPRTGPPQGNFSLHPYILVDPGAEPGVWRILVFDGVAGSGQMRAGEPLRYIDVWSGQRTQESASRATVNDLRLLAEQDVAAAEPES